MPAERKDIHNSQVPVVCQSCEARHRGVCGALTPGQLTELSKFASRIAIDEETELFGADQDAGHYSNILSGVVKLSKLMADGRQQIVGLQFAPDFLGRPFAHGGQVSAEAATLVRLCSFPRNVLERIISQSPEMEHRLHEQTLKELDEARDWMLTLGRKTAAEKIASFLLLIAMHIDPERSQDVTEFDIELPLKRADIADFLGLTIETVSRQLTKLRKQGAIEVKDRRTVRIKNLPALRNVAAQNPD